MAEIRPFVSIRPQRGKAAEIAALPYDVYNREEATKEVERHPQSFLSIDRAETQFPLSVDMYDDKVYERAHDTLWQWVEDGTFLTEEKKVLLPLRTHHERKSADGSGSLRVHR